nr:MAG TPA: hypothetical protein [Caudoviricetes sp.]
MTNFACEVRLHLSNKIKTKFFYFLLHSVCTNFALDLFLKQSTP